MACPSFAFDRLPTFMSDEKTLLRRFTMICENAKIVHCVYPVFPSHADVELVLSWIAFSACMSFAAAR